MCVLHFVAWPWPVFAYAHAVYVLNIISAFSSVVGAFARSSAGKEAVFARCVK